MQTESYDQTNLSQSFCSYSLEDLDSCYYEPSRKTVTESLQRNNISVADINCSIAENIELGNFAVAISLIDELIARCPESAIHYNNRGLIHLQNNQISEALEDLTYALEINPRLDSAYNNRANCHAAQGNLVAAVSDYDVALDLNPANVRAWINQGITFRQMNSFDLAIENFDIALIISDRLKENIYAERGRTYHLRGDWNCAVADYQVAIELLSLLDNNEYLQQVETWLNELLHPLMN